VGVLELFFRVDVAGEHHLRPGLAGRLDHVPDRLDGLLARGRVQAAVGMTEAVLHVHDHDRRAVGIELHARR